MSEKKRLNELTRILEDTSNELDVPASKYEEAKSRYKTVGEFLGEESPLADYDPLVYVQGSFGLGTATRPINGGDYDVDSVLLLRDPPVGLTPKELKELVGHRLLSSGSRYRKMIEPQNGGRRCWTIQYADSSQFHLDVLPAIPDVEAHKLDALTATVRPDWIKDSIRITDSMTREYATGWPSLSSFENDPTRSNPIGYGKFFRERMEVQLEQLKSSFAMNKRMEVAEIEDFDVRTPLQRLVQLLKRHRDINYGDDEDRPISIIITTLAAQAYSNESDLGVAMLNVVPKMRDWIEDRQGVSWVPNPVNPLENFADKWEETPRKADVFDAWLRQVEREHTSLLTESGFEKVGAVISKAYGPRPAKAAMERLAKRSVGFASAPTLLVPPKESFATPIVNAPAVRSRPWRD
ncbi:nucleotidyltransferase [Rosistilla oblonga]|uniref:nucleotidyltransferase domain-containing protein n=1 Tax=Rosistilla oblonga TaxID=2527990 RepID=UPI003A976B57